jgi:predicted metal-binding protein
VVRIIVPSSALYSDQSKEIMRLLHEVVSNIEHEAVKAGFTDSKAFAGGSCKMVFCDTHLECRRLSEDGQCRNPKHARPSMSGFGINVNDLIKKCGWLPNLNNEKTTPDNKISWVAGLIMIG